MNIKELLIERQDGNCLGDCWTNRRIDIVFKNIDLTSDSILVKSIYNFIKELKNSYANGWISEHLTLGESNKLNVIMRTKSDATLKKRLENFYWTIREDTYDFLFEKTKMKAFDKVLVAVQKQKHLWDDKIGNLVFEKEEVKNEI